MIIMKYRKIMLNDSLFISLSQFVAIPLKALGNVRKRNLKFFTVASTKDSH